MERLIDKYMDFISSNKTERRCTSAGIELAEKYGYKNIDTVDSLKPGDKVYYNKMGKSLILFNIGKDDISKGMTSWVPTSIHLDSMPSRARSMRTRHTRPESSI